MFTQLRAIDDGEVPLHVTPTIGTCLKATYVFLSYSWLSLSLTEYMLVVPETNNAQVEAGVDDTPLELAQPPPRETELATQDTVDPTSASPVAALSSSALERAEQVSWCALTALLQEAHNHTVPGGGGGGGGGG